MHDRKPARQALTLLLRDLADNGDIERAESEIERAESEIEWANRALGLTSTNASTAGGATNGTSNPRAADARGNTEASRERAQLSVWPVEDP